VGTYTGLAGRSAHPESGREPARSTELRAKAFRKREWILSIAARGTSKAKPFQWFADLCKGG